jgi:hypothetical protein
LPQLLVPLGIAKSPMNETIELLKRLAREHFYGAVTVKFEAGNVVYLKKEETFRISTLSVKPRNNDNNEQ